MATQDNNSLETKINQIGLKVGNEIQASTGLTITGTKQLYADSDGKLATAAQQPFALGATQSTSTSALFTLSGKAVADVLTNTLVAGASVTTATKAGFVRVDVTSDDNTLAGGSYYLELFTIT